MASTASFVWVQLYREETEEPDGQAIEIPQLPHDIYALAKVVKAKAKLNLHDPLDMIYTYPHGTKPPFVPENSVAPGKRLVELIDELKDETPPTSANHPLIVVATPPPHQLAPSAKKQKVAHPFGEKSGRFAKYLDDSIDINEDAEIYERDYVEQKIMHWLEPCRASPKPNYITMWSGRGSGKSSLLRKIATSSDYRVQAARDCGRLMIINAHPRNVGPIPEELQRNPTEIDRFLITLVGYHLCKVFEDTSIDEVDFTSTATIKDLWYGSDTLPSSLVEKLVSIRNGRQAYAWLRSCTKGFLSSEGQEGDGPNPIIFIENAQVLAVECVTTGYLVLEELSMSIPTNHAMVTFGTRQRRDPRKSAPLIFLSQVNNIRVAPLNALSEEAATRLYCRHPHNLRKGQVVTTPLIDLEDDQIRFVRTVYAVTAGIPRLLRLAFSSEERSQSAPRFEDWEDVAPHLYNDAHKWVTWGNLPVKCLSKAILISAVCDVELEERETIPGEEVTWGNLQWCSIAFLAGGEGANKTGQYYRIPRLLWQKAAKAVHQWIQSECKLNVHDLLPTTQNLYGFIGNAAATSSGIAWEKMFASALVARFFSLCWMQGLDPQSTYIGLDELLPQEDDISASMKTLKRVEVCLVNGISVNAEKEVIASKATLEEQQFDPRAIHANWEHSSAHHDLVLPVRFKNGDSKHRHMLYAVSARHGHYKTEAELLQTKQHLVNRTGSEEKVEGIIQALNPRLKNQSGRQLQEKEFKNLMENEKYAEVTITEGLVNYILGCFA